MSILIIDDEIVKRNELSQFISELTIMKEIHYGQSYTSGLRAIIKYKPKLILLDMSMPTYDPTQEDPRGGRPLSMAGHYLLKEIKRKKINTKVIVFTQHPYQEIKNINKSLDEITAMFHKEFPDIFIDSIFYNVTENNWKNKLQTLLSDFK